VDEPKEVERSIMKVGDSHCVGLPSDWVRKYGLKKKDRLLILYNDVITIIPKSDLVVEIENNEIWFKEGDKCCGLTKRQVKEILKMAGLKKGVDLIRKALIEKEGYSMAVLSPKLDEELGKFVIDFITENAHQGEGAKESS